MVEPHKQSPLACVLCNLQNIFITNDIRLNLEREQIESYIFFSHKTKDSIWEDVLQVHCWSILMQGLNFSLLTRLLLSVSIAQALWAK